MNSLCPGGGGRGWLAGQSEFTLFLCGKELGREGEPGGGGPVEGVGPAIHIKLITHSTEYRMPLQQNPCT